jgi:hypothetical protein
MAKKGPGLTLGPFCHQPVLWANARGIGLVGPEIDRLENQFVKTGGQDRYRLNDRIGFQGGMFPELRLDRGRFHFLQMGP